MQRHRLALGLLLAAFVTPALAADYSLRTECGRIAGSEYRDGYHVETYAATSISRSSNNSGAAFFRLAEFPPYTGHFWLNANTHPRIAEVVYESRANKKPINICYRPTDFYVYGVELAVDAGGGGT